MDIHAWLSRLEIGPTLTLPPTLIRALAIALVITAPYHAAAQPPPAITTLYSDLSQANAGLLLLSNGGSQAPPAKRGRATTNAARFTSYRRLPPLAVRGPGAYFSSSPVRTALHQPTTAP